MEMGLRQLRDITYTLHSPILPYAPAVPVALSPNVVLLARKHEAGRPPEGDGPPGAQGQSLASASSFWIRETPSTRSSSPSAYDSRR